MAKTHRGKVLWKLPAHGRGTCPICGRTRVKILWPHLVGGVTQNVCKRCHKQA